MSILIAGSDSMREQKRMYEKSFTAQKHQLPNSHTGDLSLGLQQTIGKEKERKKVPGLCTITRQRFTDLECFEYWTKS